MNSLTTTLCNGDKFVDHLHVLVEGGIIEEEARLGRHADGTSKCFVLFQSTDEFAVLAPKLFWPEELFAIPVAAEHTCDRSDLALHIEQGCRTTLAEHVKRFDLDQVEVLEHGEDGHGRRFWASSDLSSCSVTRLISCSSPAASFALAKSSLVASFAMSRAPFPAVGDRAK